MAKLSLTLMLGIVLVVFWMADGVSLTKTKVRRDADRGDRRRRIFGPGEWRTPHIVAHDHLTGIVDGDQISHRSHRRRNPHRGYPSRGYPSLRRNPASRDSTTTTTSPTTISTTTTATTVRSIQKKTIVEPTIIESPIVETAAQKELPLRPIIHADRLIPRTDPETDVRNANDVGVVNLTRTVSEGVKITVMKEDTPSETTISKQFFQDGIKSEFTCNLDPSKPTLVAGCGDYYLFPGYNVKLVADSFPCIWHFRYTAPDVILSSKGRTSERDFRLVIQEASTANSPDGTATAPAGDRYGLGGRVPRDIVIELHNDNNSAQVPAEICVPDDAKNAEADSYDQHEGVCCHSAPDTKCGLPNGAINDEDFSRKTFPWEALLAVTMKSANADKSDSTTYCSGSLISEEWLLTTAACFLRPRNNHSTSTPELAVYFDADARTNDTGSYGIKEYILYPTSSEAHDIALVRLDRMSPRSPVCLPPYNKGAINEGIINQTGIVFGWVVPQPPANFTAHMSTREQRIVSSSECSRRRGEALSPHILCTEDKVTQEEPCLADGDLLVGSEQFTLRGLSNPRLVCHSDDELRKHTSIEHFMPWISSVTGIKMRN